MLKKVKLALRINNDAYDEEITDLIDACKKELELAGIAPSNIDDKDPIIIRIIICKSNFGLDNDESEKWLLSYESLKSFLCLNYKKGDSSV